MSGTYTASASSRARPKASGVSTATGGLPALTLTPVLTTPRSRILAGRTLPSPARPSTSLRDRITISHSAPASSFSCMAPTAPNSPAIRHPASASNRARTCSTRPRAAPPLKMDSFMHAPSVVRASCLRLDGARDIVEIQRQGRHAQPQGVAHRVADGAGGGTERRLARARRRLVGPGEDPHPHIGNVGEPDDRILFPLVVGQPPVVEARLLQQGPGTGLDGAAFDLLRHAVRVDDL